MIDTAVDVMEIKMSETFNFDEEVDRSDSDSNKWDKYRGRDILPMWVADSDFRVAPAIQRALQQRAEHGVFGYTHEPARLVELVVERMQRLYDWKIHPNWLVWHPGVVRALNLVCRGNGEPGDAVYTPAVIYPPFRKAAEYSSRVNQPVPMCWQQRRLVIDLDWLEQQASKPSQVLLLCNPQNPGGAVYRQAELLRLAQIAEQQDLIVCSDEIHCDLILDSDKRHIPIATLNADIEQRSITLMAPSKTFNVAGLGCSFAIVPNKAIRQRMVRVGRGVLPYVNIMGYAAAQAAYESGDEWNRQQLAYLRGNRDLLIEHINRIPGLRLDPVEATYLAWINISELGLENPIAFFERAGVGMSPGEEFGDSNYMRLNFACPRSRVELAIERIRRAVDAHS